MRCETLDTRFFVLHLEIEIFGTSGPLIQLTFNLHQRTT